MLTLRPGVTKAVLLDFDLTLVDSVEAIVLTTNLFAEEFGLSKITRDILMANIGVPLEVSWDRYWGYHKPDWIKIYQDKYKEVELQNIKPFPDTVETLTKLKAAGIKTSLVTNRWMAKLAIKTVGLAHFFDAVVGAEEVTKPKPNAEPILKALELLGIPKDQSFYVGDSDIDVKTALAAEVDVVGVTTGALSADLLNEAGAKWTCDSLSQILGLVGLS
ncbi:MAG: HAD-IA family hydrolase [Deltaproteobacteria bacterium]|nr:HAD-IA family hydrolase [Deltaproteobacteria bacterium]